MTEYSETVYDNVIMGYGGANAHTIYSKEVKETGQKMLKVIPGIKSKTNRDGNLPTNRTLDLLRQEQRFTIIGLLDAADRTKFRALYSAGGPCTMYWDSTSYSVSIERYEFNRQAADYEGQWEIQFTVVIGNDL